jgi:hypothetical protein
MYGLKEKYMETEPIFNCNYSDFLQILTDIEDFWGSNRTLSYHHPMFVNEFGNTAFVIKNNEGNCLPFWFLIAD